jgi:hypothetical protein
MEPFNSHSPAAPATWDSASYEAPPVDFLEPLADQSSDYRRAAIRFLCLIHVVDSYICSAPGALPPRAWIEVSLAMGLPSSRGKSQVDVAAEYEVTRACISKGVTRFLRMSGLEPSWNCKSSVARRHYQQTNGRRVDQDDTEPDIDPVPGELHADAVQPPGA